MATINPHTTRATGTVLTAAIYNADHQNHIANANSLNAELIAATAAIIVTNANLVTTNNNLTALSIQSVIIQMSHMILVPTDKSYMFAIKMPFAGTITETTTKCLSGTCTAQFKVNAVNLDGAANAVSSAEQAVAHAASNTFAIGDDLTVTISANAACLDMTFGLKITKALTP